MAGIITQFDGSKIGNEVKFSVTFRILRSGTVQMMVDGLDQDDPFVRSLIADLLRQALAGLERMNADQLRT